VPRAIAIASVSRMAGAAAAADDDAQAATPQ
jgi:hypothetical protein